MHWFSQRMVVDDDTMTLTLMENDDIVSPNTHIYQWITEDSLNFVVLNRKDVVVQQGNLLYIFYNDREALSHYLTWYEIVRFRLVFRYLIVKVRFFLSRFLYYCADKIDPNFGPHSLNVV